MNYINLLPKNWITRSYDRWGQNITEWYYEETHSNIWDGNIDTYFGLYARHAGDGWVRAQLWSTHTWSKGKYIYRVKGRYRHQTYGGNYKQGWHRLIIKLRLGSSWTNIYDQTWDTGASGSNNHNAWFTRDFDLTTGWDNVTGVEMWADGYSYSYEGDRQQYIRHRFHELEIYREKYEEILRVMKGNETLRIGCCELQSTHKLRVRKGNTTVGIPLLDTDDPESSPVRIYTGSSVKSLPLAD